MKTVNGKKVIKEILWVLGIVAGCAAYALCFDIFLEPHGINGGGIAGLAMLIVHLTNVGSVGLFTFLMNIPLFILGYSRIGKRFFFGSLIGIISLSVCLDLFAKIPVPDIEPLLATVYGGLLGGIGIGLVLYLGASTGGSDILIRLLKRRLRNQSMGTIQMGFDLVVVVLTALVFKQLSIGLYCAVAIYVMAKTIDGFIYSFDYSKVALIISPKHNEIAESISTHLERGVTFLDGEGYYLHQPCKVILTAIKKQQLAELKELVTGIDPNAFIILQESHQVLGEGFAHYSQNEL